jgi:transcriptional regulator with XRE-family HTH domain
MHPTKSKLSTLAINIRKLRREKGLSQDKLSKLADVAFHTISKIEAGDTPNPTIETLVKIADALEVTVNDLLN